MKISPLRSFLLAATLLIGSSVQAEVTLYYNMVAKDPPSVYAALTGWMASEDSKSGQFVALYQYIANGENPSTHFVAAEFADMNSMEKANAQATGSPDWTRMLTSLSFVAQPTAEGLALHRAKYGKGWNEQGFGAIISVATTNAPAYAEAFDGLMKSATGRKAPGETRLMENRAGISGVTHFVVVTAPSLTALNDYLDMLYSSSDFAAFSGKVAGMRTVTGTSYFRRVASWQR
jgi:hypothetical protein